MQAQIFLGSIKSPPSGFMFNVLKDFHLQTLKSKKSAYDFIAVLCWQSNNAFPLDVPVSNFCHTQIVILVDYIAVEHLPSVPLCSLSVEGLDDVKKKWPGPQY